MSKLGKIALIMAGVSIALFGVVYLIFQGWNPFFFLLLALSAIFVFLAAYFERSNIVDLMAMKTTKDGLNNGMLVFMVIAAMISINVLGVKYYKTWDFSGAQIHSLSEQSVKLLSALNEDLKVTMFYQKGSREGDEMKRAFRELLKKYGISGLPES